MGQRWRFLLILTSPRTSIVCLRSKWGLAEKMMEIIIIIIMYLLILYLTILTAYNGTFYHHSDTSLISFGVNNNAEPLYVNDYNRTLHRYIRHYI